VPKVRPQGVMFFSSLRLEKVKRRIRWAKCH
jgi:hypothetical protein